MSSAAPITSSLSLVAKRLEGDLRARGLRAGDRYLSVNDAASVLRVSPATAHRAMELLAARRLLYRRQGRGTFVGEAIGQHRPARTRTVFVLLSEGFDGIPTVHLDPLVHAIRTRIRDVSVQFGFVPASGGVEHVRAIIDAAQEAGLLAGTIPVSCPREIYRYLAQAGAPMVVLGSLYADQRLIASVDVDYHQAGTLLAQHLVDRRHQRMVLLTTGDGRPGDHAFFDGISYSLTGAGLPHNALTVRIFPRDFSAFRAQVREVLRRPDHPTGVICHGKSLLGVVKSVSQELSADGASWLEVVFQGEASTLQEQRCTRVEPTIGFAQMAQIAADMLGRLIDGDHLQQRQVVVPVELRPPDTSPA